MAVVTGAALPGVAAATLVLPVHGGLVVLVAVGARGHVVVRVREVAAIAVEVTVGARVDRELVAGVARALPGRGRGVALLAHLREACGRVARVLARLVVGQVTRGMTHSLCGPSYSSLAALQRRPCIAKCFLSTSAR